MSLYITVTGGKKEQNFVNYLKYKGYQKYFRLCAVNDKGKEFVATYKRVI
jgi:hypothetical protein